jgi:hypothetical protein
MSFIIASEAAGSSVLGSRLACDLWNTPPSSSSSENLHLALARSGLVLSSQILKTTSSLLSMKYLESASLQSASSTSAAVLLLL